MEGARSVCWVTKPPSTPSPPPPPPPPRKGRQHQHHWSHDSTLHLPPELEEEQKDQEGECPALYCNSTGCGDLHWSTSEPVVLAGAPRASVPSQRHPGASDGLQAGPRLYSHLLESPQGLQPRLQREAPWNQNQSPSCSCVCDSREPLGPGWRGPPFIYYGVRSSLVVGMEVVEVVEEMEEVEEVEEMAIQDTLDAIAEDKYTDLRLSANLQQKQQL